MGERLRLEQAIIVEGKYDKIRLESVVDALILTTEGYGIFRDQDMRALVRRLAHTCGIVVLTDSDAAGFRIRTHLSQIARGGAVTQVYIPDIQGKERRKVRPGKEGKLGVEGMEPAVLREALVQAGLTASGAPRQNIITRQDLYDLGLMGGPGSHQLRQRLLVSLGLPARLSTSAMLPVLGHLLDRPELEAKMTALTEE